MYYNTITSSIMEGIRSFSLDMILGTNRIFKELSDEKTRQKDIKEDLRVGRLIIKAFNNKNILIETSNTIIQDCLQNLPQPVLIKIAQRLSGKGISIGSSYASKTVLKASISDSVNRFLIQRLTSSQFATKIVGRSVGNILNIIALEGILAKAENASNRLHSLNPNLWAKLKQYDYDMLYFLFEEPLKPYIELGRMLHYDPQAAEQILNEIQTY